MEQKKIAINLSISNDEEVMGKLTEYLEILKKAKSLAEEIAHLDVELKVKI